MRLMPRFFCQHWRAGFCKFRTALEVCSGLCGFRPAPAGLRLRPPQAGAHVAHGLLGVRSRWRFEQRLLWRHPSSPTPDRSFVPLDAGCRWAACNGQWQAWPWWWLVRQAQRPQQVQQQVQQPVLPQVQEQEQRRQVPRLQALWEPVPWLRVQWGPVWPPCLMPQPMPFHARAWTRWVVLLVPLPVRRLRWQWVRWPLAERVQSKSAAQVGRQRSLRWSPACWTLCHGLVALGRGQRVLHRCARGGHDRSGRVSGVHGARPSFLWRQGFRCQLPGLRSWPCWARPGPLRCSAHPVRVRLGGALCAHPVRGDLLHGFHCGLHRVHGGLYPLRVRHGARVQCALRCRRH